MNPSRYYARVFGLITFAVLAYLVVRILTPFVVPIMWGALLAFMLYPLHERLTRKRGNNVSAGLLTVATLFTVAGPLFFFGLVVFQQAGQLLTKFQLEAENRNLPALQLVLEFKPVQLLLEKAGEFTSLSQEQILKEANNAAKDALQSAATLSTTLVVGAVDILSKFGLTLFLLFFLLRDGKGMLEQGIRLVPMTRQRKNDLTDTLGGVTRAVVLGTSITALVQGTLLGIGFAIAGLPSPLVFGVLGAVASLIPVVGTALVWVPAVLTLFAQGQTGWAIFLLLWSIVLVGGSDNVVRPLIISGNSGASTLLVFIGILGGVGVFGFAGIFMGPLVLTLAQTLLEYAGQEIPRPSAPLPSPGALMPPPSAIADAAPTLPPPASEAVTEPPPSAEKPKA